MQEGCWFVLKGESSVSRMYEASRDEIVHTLDQVRGLVLAHCLESLLLHRTLPLGRYAEQVDCADHQGDDRGQDWQICAGGHVVGSLGFLQGIWRSLLLDVLLECAIHQWLDDEWPPRLDCGAPYVCSRDVLLIESLAERQLRLELLVGRPEEQRFGW
jgi:hypothetical protein